MASQSTETPTKSGDSDNNANPSCGSSASPSSSTEDTTKNLEKDTIDFEKLSVSDDQDTTTTGSTEDQKKESPLADDYVDEEALKTEEMGLSSEELAERHTKAKELKDSGNQEFKEEKFKESILSYTKGLLICPLCEKELRSILYANRGAAKTKLNCKDLAIMDCTKSLEYNPTYLKVLIRRAKLYEEMDKLDEALEDYKKIVELDPSYRDAVIACQRLPPLINERNEKLKEEMLSKLKDLGNMVLRPFGISTDNFQLEPQAGGGYSINFKK